MTAFYPAHFPMTFDGNITRAVVLGVCMLGTTLGGDTVIPISCAVVVVTIAFRIGGLITKINDRLSALEKTQEELRRTRTLDLDTLRADIITSSAPSKQTSHDTDFIKAKRLPRILLVDDDPTFRLLFAHDMKGVFEIDEAAGLEEAHNKVMRHAYDCVLLDLTLPDSYRQSTISQFVARNPNALCVAISGADDSITGEKCIQDGAHAFLNKNLWSARYCKAIVEHAIQRKKFRE